MMICVSLTNGFRLSNHKVNLVNSFETHRAKRQKRWKWSTTRPKPTTPQKMNHEFQEYMKLKLNSFIVFSSLQLLTNKLWQRVIVFSWTLFGFWWACCPPWASCFSDCSSRPPWITTNPFSALVSKPAPILASTTIMEWRKKSRKNQTHCKVKLKDLSHCFFWT